MCPERGKETLERSRKITRLQNTVYPTGHCMQKKICFIPTQVSVYICTEYPQKNSQEAGSMAAYGTLRRKGHLFPLQPLAGLKVSPKMHIYLDPQNVILIGNWVFADATNSPWI